MRIPRSILAVSVAAAFASVATGCAGASEDEPAKKKKQHTTDTGAGGAGQGLACDAYQTLATYCQGCHGEPPTGGAPTALVTHDELAAAAPAGGSYAERSLVRMKDAAAPMPPLPLAAVPPDRIASFEAWIASGMPDDCGGGGTGGAGTSPYDTPEVCTCAGMPMGSCTWLGGDHESPDMHPGRACVDCHAGKFNAPKLWIGGTVYPSAHEPDDCFGFDGSIEDAVVEVTDATMKVFTLPVRKSGNFYWTKTKGLVTMPITARVLRGGQVRAMAAPVDNGDCNSCHTLTGAGTPPAPGRIMAP